MRRLTIAVTVAVLALAACGKKKDDNKTTAGSGTTTTGAGSGSTAGGTMGSMGSGAGTATTGTTGAGAGTATTGTVGSGAGSAAVDLQGDNKAGNCPSAVIGATTVIVDDPAAAGKLVLSITAKNDAATTTIRKRVAHLVEVQGAPDVQVKHTGEGQGGGGAGMCPVLTTKDVKLAAADIEGGSKVTLEPQNGAALDAIRKDVEVRVTKTAEWAQSNIQGTATSGGGGGIGGGKGDDGSNHSGKGDGKGKGDGTGGGTGTGGGKGSAAAPPTKI